MRVCGFALCPHLPFPSSPVAFSVYGTCGLCREPTPVHAYANADTHRAVVSWCVSLRCPRAQPRGNPVLAVLVRVWHPIRWAAQECELGVCALYITYARVYRMLMQPAYPLGLW
jgi:hypothetical protein